MRFARLSLAAALAALLACATARPPAPAAGGTADGPAAGEPGPPPARIAFPPEEVKVSRAELELAGKNDAELFALGTAAFGEQDYRRAAAAFARLADVFPSSPHEPAALYNAGLAFERSEEWRLALERYRALERKYEGADALEASFKATLCLYQLGDREAARAGLDAISKRPLLATSDRIRALAQRGVAELELGRAEEAEATFRLAVSLWRGANEQEPLDPYWASQAQYYLGEVYRGWFQALPLDPSRGDDAKLRAELEHKAETLLSAQGHYLRAIRLGDDRWAVASGFRIGELYDELRRQLLDAPMPPGLSDEESTAYRAELKRRVGVLAAKAITAYEQTLSRASRSGVDDLRFLGDAQASLSRLKSALAPDRE